MRQRKGPRCTCGQVMHVGTISSGGTADDAPPPYIEYVCRTDRVAKFYKGCGRTVRLDYTGWRVVLPPQQPKAGQREKHLQGSLP